MVDPGRKAAHQYMNMKEKPTAVICYNDDVGIGMVEELKDLHIDVPGELSVMGIDGIYLRNHHTPRLTTMALYPERQGAKCVDVLVDMIEGNKYKYVTYADFEILEGDTVAKI